MTRMDRSMTGLVLSAWLVAAIPAQAQEVSSDRLLGSVFSDHMVIQRGQPIRIWGEAAPGEAVAVYLDGARRAVEADAEGQWLAEFAARAPGEAFTIAAESASGAMAEIENVVIGDVWLCSGQSNMEYPVYRALNPDSEISGSANERIRLLSITHEHTSSPRSRHETAPEWQLASPVSVRDFSAVCYFFGREQEARRDVPIGLIDASWGGSQIEAWLDLEHLREAGDFENQLALLDLHANDPDAAALQFGGIWEDWWHSRQDTTPWQDPGTGWSDVPSLTDWQGWEGTEAPGHLGLVWYRNEIEISAEQAASPARLSLAAIDEIDAVWVNGTFVGYSFGWGTHRHYDIPEGVLQAGANTITVNVHNSWGAGGMTGPAEAMQISFEGAEPAPIGSGWQYRIVPNSVGSPPQGPWQSVGGFTTIHNGMVAPLGPLSLTGALWYQGESNAGRANQYEALLHGLLATWRDQFGQPDLPVFIVQLPNFGSLQSGPVESGWARLREAERQVALADPHAGLAVAIDLGDRFDIHPPNKQAVAQRLLRSVESQLYGSDLSPHGAEPVSVTREDGAVIIGFEGDGGSLMVVGDARPSAFEVCNDTACRFAEAQLDGSRIILHGETAETASRVRYCWADAPICTLYDATGLPVTPFEEAITD